MIFFFAQWPHTHTLLLVIVGKASSMSLGKILRAVNITSDMRRSLAPGRVGSPTDLPMPEAT